MIHFTKIFNFLVFLCTLVSSSRMRGWRGYLLMEASFIQATFLLKRQIVAEKEPRLLSKKSFWLRDPTWVDNESRSQLEFDNFCYCFDTDVDKHVLSKYQFYYHSALHLSSRFRRENYSSNYTPRILLLRL